MGGRITGIEEVNWETSWSWSKKVVMTQNQRDSRHFAAVLLPLETPCLCDFGHFLSKSVWGVDEGLLNQQG